jgi:hypothetical protein
MNWRYGIAVLIAFFCILHPTDAQEAPLVPVTVAPAVVRTNDFHEVVVPITVIEPRLGLQGFFGTGFCLDPACRFIGTNYHVAKMTRIHNINGVKIVRR